MYVPGFSTAPTILIFFALRLLKATSTSTPTYVALINLFICSLTSSNVLPYRLIAPI